MTQYSAEVCTTLEEKFRAAGLYRPMRIARYEAGKELVYDVTAVGQLKTGRVRLLVEQFVGGGFAGQVYRVRILEIDTDNGQIGNLEPGGVYAMKILIPPSGLSRIFRNALYWLGFQGPFQLQVNPTAVRAGALWQKFIRRAAKIKFADEGAVVDIHATFVDSSLGSCGELSEWVDGRTWRLEVDDHLDTLALWRKGRKVDSDKLGSEEYRAKRKFMRDFVRLLHEIGAYEFARQYEWSTCKSQPNCLKRKDTEGNPPAGLVAVDFRAGLALLPFLPMSPGDFKLIAKGIGRGSLVQFDRGDVNKLEAFVRSHHEQFSDMQQMLEELKSAEHVYRDSIPDITHNHLRLLYSGRLWSTMLNSAVTGWKVKNLVDEQHEQKLRDSKVLTLVFSMVGILPFLGTFIRRIWARPDWRKHYKKILTNWEYFKNALKARIAEKLIVWHRSGRVGPQRAIKLAEQPWRLFCHLPLSVLPAGLHRFLTDRQFSKEKLAYIFVRPIRLYFNAELREQWLRDMLIEGQRKHMLSDKDALTIISKLKEPFIQRYLISLVVHLLTLPITQIVSGIHVLIWNMMHPEATPAERTAISFAIAAIYQVIPISPGSFCRGLWAVGIAIYDRSFKNYNIAVFLSFFKYIGYLAFPIQMTYHYPALSRFMAAHWSTALVHIVPVFGERGALLEHWVFRLFYNWPLTIRRRMRKRAQLRASMEPRYWHIVFYAILATGILLLTDNIYMKHISNQLPRLRDIWWLLIVMPLVCGALVTLGCGGAVLWRRFVSATFCSILTGLFYTVASLTTGYLAELSTADFVRRCVYSTFIFALLSTIGAIVTELKLPDAELK